MQKRPVPAVWAGEFPQNVIWEFGVSVKVIYRCYNFQTQGIRVVISEINFQASGEMFKL